MEIENGDRWGKAVESSLGIQFESNFSSKKTVQAWKTSCEATHQSQDEVGVKTESNALSQETFQYRMKIVKKML